MRLVDRIRRGVRLIARQLTHILQRMQTRMRVPDTKQSQLGFDFGSPNAVESSSDAWAFDASGASLPPLQRHGIASPAVVPPSYAPRPATDVRDKPSRGRTATRARTAVLFSRLQDLGLRGVDVLVLMRTRTVMVSLSGRTLRVNEGYADAPERVLRAIVTFATARTKANRNAARDEILAFETDRAPAPRRVEIARPGDLALISQLAHAHSALNGQHFAGALTSVAIRLSGRMATRLAHYDPGSKHVASEIVMSRKHVVKHGWKEAMHTLLHEMVHQWQHESGAPLDHGAGFRKKAREVGIAPAARRDVMPLERKRRRIVGAE